MIDVLAILKGQVKPVLGSTSQLLLKCCLLSGLWHAGLVQAACETAYAIDRQTPAVNQVNAFFQDLSIPKNAVNGQVVATTTFSVIFPGCQFPNGNWGRTIGAPMLRFRLESTDLPSGAIYNDGLSTGLSVTRSNVVFNRSNCSGNTQGTGGYTLQSWDNNKGIQFAAACDVSYSITYTFTRNSETIRSMVFPTSRYSWLGTHIYKNENDVWGADIENYPKSAAIDPVLPPVYTTCLLDMGDGASTSSGVKTVHLGNFTTSSMQTASYGLFGQPKTVIFSLKNQDGSQCTFGSENTKWDIRFNLQSSEYSTTNTGNVDLISGNEFSGSASSVGVYLTGDWGPNVTVGKYHVKPSVQKDYPLGTLLSTQRTPQANPSDKMALTMQFYKKYAGVELSPGAFTKTLSLDIIYQ